jgi:tetratricopeptide (TPR) repeat protein
MRGGYTQLHRGVQAVQKGEYAVAVEAFAQALKTEPDNANLRVSLARSLYLAGDQEAGRRELEAALERDPDHVLANFLLAVLLLEDGEDQSALAHLEKVLALQPEHAGGHHYLGHLSMDQGRYAEAARHYAASLRNSPRDHPALFMQAMALYRADAPQTRVKALLEAGVAEHPDKWMFSYALARLLAASPDGQVRDGKRALELAQRLYDRFPGFQNAEALAMAHAELGDYKQAIGMQNYAIANAVFMGALDQVPAMEQTLARFRQDRPARRPFYENDPFFRAPPFDPSGPIRDYPTRNPY